VSLIPPRCSGLMRSETQCRCQPESHRGYQVARPPHRTKTIRYALAEMRASFHEGYSREKPIIFWMGCPGRSQNLFRRIRHEQCFVSYTDALATIARVHLGSMPCNQAALCSKRASDPDCGKFFGISHLFHDQGLWTICHTDVLMWKGTRRLMHRL
jgi:hypothetical protein